jgi:glycosyltransferase involved in cell wall biosynthesis
MSLSKPTNTLWIVSELYYPEETSTGHIMTHIAEYMASTGETRVGALCAQPTYSKRGTAVPKRESRNGVDIERCSGTSLDKDRMALKIVNIVTITWSLFVNAMRRFRSGDLVLVVTNPPVLPFLIALACRFRGARYAILIHDVYPDILVAAGLLSRISLMGSIICRMNRALYRRAENIIVIGRDMASLVESRAPEVAEKISVIPNWADLDEIQPDGREDSSLLAQLGFEDHFVVLYAGNMGKPHGVEIIADAAKRLKESNIRFVFLGNGAKRPWLEAFVARESLTNIVLLDGRPRSEQRDFLNSCDVGIMSLLPGMKGVSVPSRTYNIGAAGKPLIAVVEPGSEIDLLIREHKIGWSVEPEDVEALVRALLEAESCPEATSAMGRRARSLVENEYSRERILRRYRSVLLPSLHASPVAAVALGDRRRP